MSLLFLLCFFFQAEDGIRDLVRSRGLGDVYKRQVLLRVNFTKYVLLPFRFFLAQNISSLSRVARYTPSLSCILTSKISSKSNKANL